jgi:hypothetical protein
MVLSEVAKGREMKRILSVPGCQDIFRGVLAKPARFPGF